MNQNLKNRKVSRDNLTRRRFISACAVCSSCIIASPFLHVRSASAIEPVSVKPKIRLVFCEAPNDKPIWPNIGYDFKYRRDQLLKSLRSGCPDVDFLPVVVLSSEEAKKWLEHDSEVDGYLIYILGLTWQQEPLMFCRLGKPTLLVDDLYGGSGEFLTQLPVALSEKLPVEWVSSSSIHDVVDSARCFKVLKKPGKSKDDFVFACRQIRLKNTKKTRKLSFINDPVIIPDFDNALKRLGEKKILFIGGGWGGDEFRKAAGTLLGTQLVQLPFEDLSILYDQADRNEGEQFAQDWITHAKEIVEPGHEEIINSGLLYVAMKNLMRKHDADGISINCLGGFYGGHLKAYPCLGFSQLNNDGLVGGCEADQMSALTMMVGNTLTGRPGFISDPVIDTSKNQIVYAHCVAPTKIFGPDGEVNPYLIRDHSEDRKGASIQSLLPTGYMTTTFEIDPMRKEVIFHQARSAENIDEDKACRTKLAAEVIGDIEKMTTGWKWGWHRVTFYGDLKPHLEEFCNRFNMKMTEEA